MKSSLLTVSPSQAFSLLEVLVALAAISVLAAVAVTHRNESEEIHPRQNLTPVHGLEPVEQETDASTTY